MITLAQLDASRDDWADAPYVSELIDYARERAAREACVEAGPQPGLVSLTAHSNADGTCKWEADWITPFHVWARSGFQVDPTAAYLALLEKLEVAR